jgi:hypothetical protein
MMTHNRWRTSGRRLVTYTIELAFIAVISAVCLAGSVRAASAASSYGPPQPAAGVAPPGGYSSVITSQTISPAGGTIGPVAVDGATATLVIPAGAFPVSVQITITGSKLFAVGDAGTAGYKAVAGVGIQVQENGSTYPGGFRKPLTLTIRSSFTTSSSVVMVWNGTAFVTEPDATVTSGTAVVRFDTDPDFAVMSPLVTTAAAPIADATRSETGQPFLGEGILACALIVLGAGGLAVGRRKRAELACPTRCRD